MKKEAMEVLLNRRSIRAYKATQIEDAQLNAVLEAGTYAPTGGGAQSPLIVVVQDAKVIAELSKINAEIMGKDMDPYYGAPTVAIVFAPKSKNTYLEDGSIVLAAMQYAAYAAGLGSVWIHRQKETFVREDGMALMRKWGVPEEFTGIGALAIGYPEGPHPEPAPRKEGYVIRA